MPLTSHVVLQFHLDNLRETYELNYQVFRFFPYTIALQGCDSCQYNLVSHEIYEC